MCARYWRVYDSKIPVLHALHSFTKLCLFLYTNTIIWKKLNTERMQERNHIRFCRRSFIKSVDLIYSFHRKNFPCQGVWRADRVQASLCRVFSSSSSFFSLLTNNHIERTFFGTYIYEIPFRNPDKCFFDCFSVVRSIMVFLNW